MKFLAEVWGLIVLYELLSKAGWLRGQGVALRNSLAESGVIPPAMPRIALVAHVSNGNAVDATTFLRGYRTRRIT